MKIIARSFLLMFMLACGACGDEEDSTCTPGSGGGGTEARCDEDSDCRSCHCSIYMGNGFCSPTPAEPS